MARKGWLRGERVGRNSFYTLTRRGRRLLEEGQARIYHPSGDRMWDGSWFLLAYSIPQDERKQRDRLRDRLAWLGLGSIGNGLWISPHDVSDEIAVLAQSMGLEDHLLSFRGHPVRESEVAQLVARCWDLDALQRDYEAFVSRWKPIAAEVRSLGGETEAVPERFFALRFELIHEYRRFPLVDPHLPRALLPSPWWGDAAAGLFRKLHGALVGPADAHVDAALDCAPPHPAIQGSSAGQASRPV